MPTKFSKSKFFSPFLFQPIYFFFFNINNFFFQNLCIAEDIKFILALAPLMILFNSVI